MASWTDKPIQFSPYVQQLPVDAMVSVGMQKQALYNQGYQRIQSQIDNVAGLDVIRDVDKNYLNSKMNKLGDNLKFVAAGDFSDFQLVNSIGGMVNSVAKDENIINAVSSTSRYRKGISDMQKAIKDGKSSPSNEWDFQTKAEEWLNSPDLKQSFSGGYHPYTDYKKKMIDILKSLKPDVDLTDISFTTNSKGEIVPTDATTRRKLSGISPEKIQQAMMSLLSPSDWKQMEIDGRYNYANIPGEQFANSINTSYKEKYNEFLNQRNVLKNSLNSTSSAPEKAVIMKQIEGIDKVLKGVVSEYENIAETFTKGDAESAKARLYTTNFINGFSRAFSYTESEITQETNPNAVIAMQREIKNQDWRKFLITEGRLERALDLDERKFKFERDEAKKKRDDVSGGLGSVTVRDDVPEITTKIFEDKLNADVASLANSDNAFLSKKGKDMEWFEQQLEAYTKGGGDSDVVEYFDRTAELRRTVNSNYSTLKDINKLIEQKYGDIYRNIPSDAQPLNINGKSFSPREMVDFNSKLEEIRTYTGATDIGGIAYTYDDEKASRNLSPKEMVLYNSMKKRDYGNYLNDNDKDALSSIEYYQRKVNDPYKNVLKEVRKDVQQEITNRVGMSQGGRYTIGTEDKAGQINVGNLLLMVRQDAIRQKGKFKDFDPEKAEEIAPKVSNAFIEVVEGTEFNPEPIYRVSATSPDGTIEFELTQQQKMDYLGNQYEASPNVSAIREYQYQMMKTGKETTAYDGNETNLYNAYLDRSQFPRTHYGISGNLESATDRTGKPIYQFRLNVYDPIEGIWHQNIGYPPEGYVSEDKVNDNKMMISDELIYELLHGTIEGYNPKELEKASKKPF